MTYCVMLTYICLSGPESQKQFCHLQFTYVIVHFCLGLGLILSLRLPQGYFLRVSIPDLIRSLRSTGGWITL